MRAKLGALGRVERALEEGAEDGRLDAGPVQARDVGEDRAVPRGAAGSRRCSSKRPPLKWGTRSQPKKPPLLISAKRVPSWALKASGLERVASISLAKRLLGSRPMSSAKRQKRRRIRKWAARSEPSPHLRSASARRANSRAASWVTSSVVWRARKRSGSVHSQRRLLQLAGVEQLVEGEAVDLLDGAGEVGVDLDRLDVGDDEQRRVFQRLAVLEELLVGAVEVGVLALVLPGERAALPHIGPALPAALLGQRPSRRRSSRRWGRRRSAWAGRGGGRGQ